MGLAAAWRLSLRGVQAVVLERFSPGHAHGSSHGATRIFRFAYDDARYVAMAQQALPLWREAAADLVTITGGLDIGDPAFLHRCAAALRSHGAEARELSTREARERFPWVSFGDQPVLYS